MGCICKAAALIFALMIFECTGCVARQQITMVLLQSDVCWKIGSLVDEFPDQP